MATYIGARTQFLLSLSTIISIVFLDWTSKIFFINQLTPGESIPVIKNFFHFTLIHNTGIAFGLFKNHRSIFVIIPIIVVLLILFNIHYHRINKDISKSSIVAFALILGGAIGNLIDRFFFGYVIDFIDFRIWPVFNIADCAITIGTIILFLKCIPSFAK